MRRTSLPIPAVAFVLCMAFAVIAGFLVLHGSDDQANHVTVLGRRVALTRSESFGHEVFADHCAACHQLAASRSIGQVGPDLDQAHPSYSQVFNAVKNGEHGSYGNMASGLATGRQLYAVASYVSRVATPSAYHPQARAAGVVTLPEDLGDPISYAVLESGTPVYSAEGARIGTVSHVLAAEQEDIFDGIIIGDLERDVVGPGERHRFVDAPEVAHIHEHAVLLTIDDAACRELHAPSENPGEITADPADQPSPLGGKLRRAWDVISGNW